MVASSLLPRFTHLFITWLQGRTHMFDSQRSQPKISLRVVRIDAAVVPRDKPDKSDTFAKDKMKLYSISTTLSSL